MTDYPPPPETFYAEIQPALQLIKVVKKNLRKPDLTAYLHGVSEQYQQLTGELQRIQAELDELSLRYAQIEKLDDEWTELAEGIDFLDDEANRYDTSHPHYQERNIHQLHYSIIAIRGACAEQEKRIRESLDEGPLASLRDDVFRKPHEESLRPLEVVFERLEDIQNELGQAVLTAQNG